ncbi:MAG: DUF5677 domain-containing protein [Candidatus Acidiferrales bacterium]
MASDASALAAENADKFYTVIKSMHAFDAAEVKGVIDTIISPTPRDNCFIGTYYRTLGNVETLLRLNKSKDFQAIAMLARALFELSVDCRFLENTPQAWVGVLEYANVEKLRAAKKIIKFKQKNPDAAIDTTIFDSFVARNAERITRVQKSLWPNSKELVHWSGLTLRQRVEQLKAPFDQVYAVDYARLSWYVHSGLTGVMNLAAEVFIHLCAYAYHIASIAYSETLLSVVRAFKISKADEKIEEKLRVAKMLPFTKSPEQATILMGRIR